MSTSKARPRPVRADARRNAERLLAEADATFRESGTDASLESIARRAGVAIGTLYAHFPNRIALVNALLRDRHDVLFGFGERLQDAPSPAAALESWIRAVVDHAATYRGLAELLAGSLDNDASGLGAACARMARIGDDLTVRASESGALRANATGADVVTLINAAAWTREHTSADQSNRLLNLALTGLLTDR